MDIQKLVDARVRKLRSQMEEVASGIDGETGDKIHERRHRGGPPDAGLRSSDHSQEAAYPRDETREEVSCLKWSTVAEMVDTSLVEVAERIFSLTDRIAGDFTRIEKDILNSRLAVLQAAEEVLDIAISLRRKTRKIVSTSDNVPEYGRRLAEAGRRAELPVSAGAGGDCYILDGRASMHAQGVASLFRKT